MARFLEKSIDYSAKWLPRRSIIVVFIREFHNLGKNVT